MISVNELKTGKIFKDGEYPYQVLKYSLIKSGRYSVTVKVRVRNLINGAVIEKNYLAGSPIEEANIERKNAQFLYKQDENYVFMDLETYNQFPLSNEVLGDDSKYLADGSTVQVMYFEGNPVSIELPKNLVFEVKYTEPGNKGNTVTNVLKEATLSNGTVVKVPTFIKIGDMVKIDTRTGEYISKGSN